jgi:hypothetical protein
MGMVGGQGPGGVHALHAQALAHLETARAALARAQRAEEGAPRFSSSALSSYGGGNAGAYVGGDGGVVENEDESVFPGVQATCRTCRRVAVEVCVACGGGEASTKRKSLLALHEISLIF